MKGEIVLVILILVGIMGQAKMVAAAASILLVLKLMKMQRFFPMLERRSLEIGLLFLMVSILIPIIDGQMDMQDLTHSFLTAAGLITILGGIIATAINGPGLTMLHLQPQLMVGIMIGSIIGIVFLDGIPVGPLTSGAIVYVFMKIYHWLKRLYRSI